MVVVAVLAVLFAALWIEAVWRLAIAAVVWTPILFCAVAAMHWTASLHLANPVAPLYTFVSAGLAGRFIFVLVVKLFDVWSLCRRCSTLRRARSSRACCSMH